MFPAAVLRFRGKSKPKHDGFGVQGAAKWSSSRHCSSCRYSSYSSQNWSVVRLIPGLGFVRHCIQVSNSFKFGRKSFAIWTYSHPSQSASIDPSHQTTPVLAFPFQSAAQAFGSV
ncbi:hypothetical protein AKJ16_DCAP12632 [Drosera capensis]